jgi:hypothetical protein
MSSDELRKMMAIQQARGVERHSVALFAIDSCFLQLARDKHLSKGQVLTNRMILAPGARDTTRFAAHPRVPSSLHVSLLRAPRLPRRYCLTASNIPQKCRLSSTKNAS